MLRIYLTTNYFLLQYVYKHHSRTRCPFPAVLSSVPYQSCNVWKNGSLLCPQRAQPHVFPIRKHISCHVTSALHHLYFQSFCSKSLDNNTHGNNAWLSFKYTIAISFKVACKHFIHTLSLEGHFRDSCLGCPLTYVDQRLEKVNINNVSYQTKVFIHQ